MVVYCPTPLAFASFAGQIYEVNLGMIGIDNCRRPFVQCELEYLEKLFQIRNANTKSPYFTVSDFAFAHA